ncbi:Smg-4/UPF3 family-domain-containing protein [Phyllosticta paracitricarpa]
MAPPAAPAAAGTNGVLPVPAAVLQKTNNKSSDSPARGSSNRSNAPRLKVVVRRLAPGLTQTEFEDALGEEWKLGAGKVDWFSYKPGKVSKDLAKPSRPARAYLHLTDQTSLAILADKVRKTAFQDAKNTTKDPALVGPPSLEFAPYTRIPAGRRRNDARQGLIDQDPEFKDFLESLTNPVTKPTPTDVTSDAPEHKEEIKTTPLIEHLKEKKAAKEKPQTTKTQGKKAETKEDKSANKSSDKKGGRKGGKETVASSEKPAKQTKVEKSAKEATPKEPVKILNKEPKLAPSPAPASTSDNAKASATPPAERKRERGNANLVKQMLQRDLGIGPAAGERRAQKAAKAGTDTPGDQPKNGASTPPAGPKILKKPGTSSQQQQKPAPAASAPAPTNQALEGSNTSSKATTNSQQQPAAQGRQQNSRNTPTSPTPAPNSKQAFLKHANASQGITEPLIEAALGAFGSVVRVEIDKRKGFAYVDFTDPSGLQKAVAASPIKIAEGAVQVLERKERPQQRGAAKGGAPAAPPTGPAQGSGRAGGVRGGRGGRGRGNGANATPAAKAAAPAADTPS